MARQGENRGVHVGMHMLHAELLIETPHGTFGRVVVFAEVAQHDALDARMVDLGDETRRFLVAQMPERPRNTLL